jgi:transcriptional regulator with XRE-family HTH domain
MLAFGEKIKQVRQAKGISLEKLHEMTKVSKTHLFQLEKGEFTNPTMETLKKIADALGTTVTNLLNEDQKFDLNTIPESLKDFMEFYSDQMDISLAHIRMLATMQMREDTAPKTKEHWKILYDAVKGALDRQNNR